MAQYDDIKQKIEQGLTDRQIAKAVGRRRTTISEIKSGKYQFEQSPDLPDWMSLLNWPDILKDIGLKHPIKFIWEESAKNLTSYSNFTKYLYKKYPYLKHEPYTHREFNPGERVEVDWAGDVITWIDPSDGKVNKAYIFVGFHLSARTSCQPSKAHLRATGCHESCRFRVSRCALCRRSLFSSSSSSAVVEGTSKEKKYTEPRRLR